MRESHSSTLKSRIFWFGILKLHNISCGQTSMRLNIHQLVQLSTGLKFGQGSPCLETNSNTLHKPKRVQQRKMDIKYNLDQPDTWMKL